MNKGRNILLIMVCLLSISLLSFLTLLGRENKEGMVDGVRYYQISSEDGIFDYEFYFADSPKTTAVLTQHGDSEWTVTVEGCPFEYKICGTDRDDATVTFAESSDGEIGEDSLFFNKAPFAVCTEDFFVSMVFGKKPVLTVVQAVIVGLIALAGGLCVLFCEELWHLINKKSEEEYPKWEELTPYKTVGWCVVAAAVVLLIVFTVF